MRFSISYIYASLLFASGMGALALPVTIPPEAEAVSTRNVVERGTFNTALNRRAAALALLDELDRRGELSSALLSRMAKRSRFKWASDTADTNDEGGESDNDSESELPAVTIGQFKQRKSTPHKPSPWQLGDAGVPKPPLPPSVT